MSDEARWVELAFLLMVAAACGAAILVAVLREVRL